jgi:hypothetical protein
LESRTAGKLEHYQAIQTRQPNGYSIRGYVWNRHQGNLPALTFPFYDGAGLLGPRNPSGSVIRGDVHQSLSCIVDLRLPVPGLAGLAVCMSWLVSACDIAGVGATELDVRNCRIHEWAKDMSDLVQLQNCSDVPSQAMAKPFVIYQPYRRSHSPICVSTVLSFRIPYRLRLCSQMPGGPT